MMHNINTGYLQAEIRCDTDAEQCSAAEEEDGKMLEQAPLLISVNLQEHTARKNQRRVVVVL